MPQPGTAAAGLVEQDTSVLDSGVLVAGGTLMRIPFGGLRAVSGDEVGRAPPCLPGPAVRQNGLAHVRAWRVGSITTSLTLAIGK